MARGPKNLAVSFTDEGLTHFGGLLLVQRFLQRHNCLNWFKRYCAPAVLQRATLQRLRQQLFLAPAVLVRPTGRPTLRLAASYPVIAVSTPDSG